MIVVFREIRELSNEIGLSEFQKEYREENKDCLRYEFQPNQFTHIRYAYGI